MKIIDKDDMRLKMMEERGEKNLVGKQMMDEFEEQLDQKYKESIGKMVAL